MQSRNPVFGSSPEFQRSGYATFRDASRSGYAGGTYAEPPRTPSAADLESAYRAPSATPLQTGRMTLDDVIMRTTTLFAALLLTALPTYVLVGRLVSPGAVYFVALGSGLVAMVLSFLAQRRGRPNVPVMLAFALFEGVFIGGISHVYAAAFGGDLIWNAVLGTLSAFGAMLLLYKTGVIRNSPKFTKILMITGAGYLVFMLVNLLGVLTGLWSSPYAGGGLLPILLSGFGVVLASLFLVLDFDFIDQGLRNGLPQEFAWTAGFGLITTLAWMYVEILRLLAILRGND